MVCSYRSATIDPIAAEAAPTLTSHGGSGFSRDEQATNQASQGGSGFWVRKTLFREAQGRARATSREISAASPPTPSWFNQPTPLKITTWPRRYHLFAILGILLASGLSGALLARYTDAAFPYADSFTTWGAIVTTWMVARKILENWFYWFVIDSVGVFLYYSRELYLTAGLFVLYLVLVVVGYLAWHRSYAESTSNLTDDPALDRPGSS